MAEWGSKTLETRIEDECVWFYFNPLEPNRLPYIQKNRQAI